MILEINALDCLFFRNGKSFNRGADTWADGMFPPSPSVLYGALRTLYFAKYPEELHKAGKGDIDPTKNLKIINIWYQFQNTVLLPAPLDIVEKKDKDAGKKWRENKAQQYEGVQLHQYDTEGIYGNFKTKYVGYYEDAIEAFADALLTPTAYSQYLKGKASTITCHKISDYIIEEPKIGIARDNTTHTAAEGHLYRVGMLRLKDDFTRASTPKQFKILVEIEGLALEPSLSRLGAEGKIVQFKKMEKRPQFASYLTHSNYFRLTLKTPAIFKSTGWNPNAFFEQRGIDVELLAAAVGKEQRIGGFDMVKRRPKMMHSAVPAGSTYYYKAKNNTSNEIHNMIASSQSLSEVRGEEGFGLYSFSSVDFEQLISKK